ncbi:MAG TPA: HU family DNA-binding protein [Candidatus Paceibacterota bacterium]|nr:HU family DNA-binding protein [Candidatus Paceibacterota bacterium]
MIYRGIRPYLSVIVTISPMNKQDIAEKVQGVLGGTKADAERAVESMIDTVVSALKRNEEVSIAGLGIFKTKMRAARTARNPRTGESVNVPSMRVPKFQPAKALKDAVK